MTNRQRFGILLMTSALVGGLSLPAAATELTPAPVAATPAPAPVAATPAPAPAPVAAAPAPARIAATPAPAKVAKVTHATHKIVARIAAPVSYPVQQRPYEIASSEPTNYSCRYCAYAMMFGIAY